MTRPRPALLRRTAFAIAGVAVLGGLLQGCGAPAAPTITSAPVQPLSDTSATSSAAPTTTATTTAATTTPQPVTAPQGLVGIPAQGKVRAAPKVASSSAARPAPKPAVQQPPAPKPPPQPAPQPAAAQPAPKSASYANCAAAKAAGAAPLRRGEPGYSTKLDRDGDGVACET
jgi:hypothetical protein